MKVDLDVALCELDLKDAQLTAAQARIALLEEALGPFAKAADRHDKNWPNISLCEVEIGYCRMARAALAAGASTLGTVTERMEKGWHSTGDMYDSDDSELLRAEWSAMLAASPITPGDSK